MDELNLDPEYLKGIIFGIMMVLYSKGITEVHYGGLLRLLGVDNETAAQYDDQVIAVLDVDGQPQNVPSGTSIH